jgi:metallo-beta-lactamase class B
MASAADAALLARGGKGDFHFHDRLSYEPVTADRILRDGDKVELGGVTMIAHLTPGHTQGCTTWTMNVNEGSHRHHVVFVGSTTVPGYKLVNNRQYPTIVTDYERSFRVLRSLPCDVFLASHASFYSMREKLNLMLQVTSRNPFVDAQEYREFVANSEQAFRDELRRQQKSATTTPNKLLDTSRGARSKDKRKR